MYEFSILQFLFDFDAHFSVSQIILLLDADWKLDSHGELLSFFFVHAWAMLSTITNPILYGWLNTNLKHLFRAMIPTVKHERNDHEELTTEHIEHNNIVATSNGISKDHESVFSWFQRLWSGYNESSGIQEEQNELVEMGENDLTRVSLVNHSPSLESDQSVPKQTVMMNDHAVNGIEVVEVETIC